MLFQDKLNSHNLLLFLTVYNYFTYFNSITIRQTLFFKNFALLIIIVNESISLSLIF